MVTTPANNNQLLILFLEEQLGTSDFLFGEYCFTKQPELIEKGATGNRRLPFRGILPLAYLRKTAGIIWGFLVFSKPGNFSKRVTLMTIPAAVAHHLIPGDYTAGDFFILNRGQD